MSALDTLKSRYADFNALAAATAMMDWDQQTFMPRGGAEARAAHLGLLSRMAHDVITSDEMRRGVEEAEGQVEGEDAAMIRVLKRSIDIATKIPSKLVEEKSTLAAHAHEAWVKARKENDFKGFSGILERMFEIARQEAEYLGYTEHIYDALLDQYEEGATAADARRMFEAIKGPQVELVRKIAQMPEPDDSFLFGDWDKKLESAFTEMLVKSIGFDMNRGRQDTAPHPFCTGWSIGDVRLTTRFLPYLASAIMGSLHEAGHGMYEQGSPMEWDRTPLAGGVSLGVHESQSRLWENIVGRSLPFWSHFLPKLQEAFSALAGIDLQTYVRAINKVRPSFIRVEADELTYNLHVLTRFEIECDVLTGATKVQDIPEAWNAKYAKYLGITPSSDSEGCLQDVHWSQGSIGYFPTYSMGNLLSYQIWHTLQKDVPNTDELMGRGEFAPILGWLREHLYSKGRSLPPKQLIQQVTGKPMGAEDYLHGLEQKYTELYGLS